MMKVTPLYHSGVLIEDDTNQLFFDVFTNVEDRVDTSKKVYFFASHSHSDHYNLSIEAYAGERTYYVYSDDIQSQLKSNVLFVAPNECIRLNDLTIQTYGSTDLGVSFLVKASHTVIFHAGDLNWWHWESATPKEQQDEEKAYKTIIDGIEDIDIDVACIPVDPRLKSAAFWAADYFLATKKVGELIPIHYGDEAGVVEKYRKHRLQVTGKEGNSKKLNP